MRSKEQGTSNQIRKQASKQHSMDTPFTVLLLLMFALFALVMAAMGSGIYRSGMTKLDENFTSRTAVSYLAEKVRSHKEKEMLWITDWNGQSTAVFLDTIDGKSYKTYVYYYDGALRELMLPQEREPAAELGNEIVKLADFSIEEMSEEGLEGIWRVSARSEDGGCSQLLLSAVS